jgi:hypothetical protein
MIQSDILIDSNEAYQFHGISHNYVTTANMKVEASNFEDIIGFYYIQGRYSTHLPPNWIGI